MLGIYYLEKENWAKHNKGYVYGL